jgi:hypothetical protein
MYTAWRIVLKFKRQRAHAHLNRIKYSFDLGRVLRCLERFRSPAAESESGIGRHQRRNLSHFAVFEHDFKGHWRAVFIRGRKRARAQFLE